MPIYEHRCNKCEHEWEDIFKLSAPVPNKCPSCGKKGKIVRLLSMIQARVELTGHELKQKIQSDAKKYANKSYRSDKVLEDIVGNKK